jgi:integrase
MPECKNPNHPKKGSSIKSEPIRDLDAIERIKDNLSGRPRDLLLFTMGINTALRLNELLGLEVRDVMYGVPGQILELKLSKQNRYRSVMINYPVYRAIAGWLDVHPDPQPSAPVFRSRKTGDALTVSTCSRMVKHWCAEAGLYGRYSGHSLRKTWATMMRTQYSAPLELISKALGHSCPNMTERYAGIVPEDVIALYRNEV